MSVEIIGSTVNDTIKEELVNLLQEAILSPNSETTIKRCNEFVEIVCKLILISTNRKSENKKLNGFDGEDTLNRFGIRTRDVNGELLITEIIVDNVCAKWETFAELEKNQIGEILDNLYKKGIDRPFRL